MSFVASDCAWIAVNTKSRRKAFDKSLLLSATAITLIVSPAAYANPLGGAVSTGSASISSSSNKTNVNQKSEDVVIDWSSFNIGSGQTTQFYQPNAQAIAVNRIGGANASQILGTLDANGRVVLINGNGVLFGKGAQVNVGSLIATSTDGSDSDVLSGKFTQAGKQSASVINNGAINAASGGTVALVAPNVTNTGTVNAKLGTVALGAANKFTVDFSGDGLVSFAAQGDVNARALAINSGLLSGANVSMTAHAANGIATGIVNTSGIITAQGVQSVGGTIYLNAGNGTLTTTGTLNAAGAIGGGQIETSGHVANISGHITAGKNGLWKVDPEDLTIDSNAAATIDGALNGGTSVLEQTTSGAASGTGNQTSGAGDINVESALSWNSAATLTLDSYHSINIDAPITITGGGGLALLTNDNGGSGGSLSFGLTSSGFTGSVSYAVGTGEGVAGQSLTVNGTPYTLLYSMNDVQNVNNNLNGNYALAGSLDASGTTGWVPLGTNNAAAIQNGGHGFAGTFEGLGNTISNLSADTASYVGLFGYSTGTIADVGVLGGSFSGNIDIGGLVGDNGGTIANAYATGAVNGTAVIGGLAGFNGGMIANSYATGAVNGSELVGGLVGENNASIVQSFATGAVTVADYYGGGLAGINSGAIATSYATGTVIGAGGAAQLGGLVGWMPTGVIANSYATGAVNVGNLGSDVGGLVGEFDDGLIETSYSTGAVTAGSGSNNIGGLLGSAIPGSGTIADTYWDLDTSGIANSTQGAGNSASYPGIAGMDTSALQGALPSGFTSPPWSTGTGLYPYLAWQFSGTPQAITGFAYKDAGVTADESDTVAALMNGNALTSGSGASVGADGSYYILLAPGTIGGSGNQLLAYSTQGASLVENASGSISGLNIDGNTFLDASSVSSSYSGAMAKLAMAEGSNTTVANFVSGLGNIGITSSAATFTVDEAVGLSSANVDIADANNITVSAAQSWSNANTLTLNAGGALTIDAPISVNGAGGVVLDAGYDTTTVPGTSLLELSFGLGPSGFAGDLNYAKGSGEGISGQSLTINGTPYTLLYSMSDVDSIDCSSVPQTCVNPDAENLAGNYALASSLDASGFGFQAIGIGVPGSEYSGMFEGLGHTISNLSFANLNPPAGQGLFSGSSGTIRDIGMVGGSVCCGGSNGFLVGVDAGVIENTFETGTVQSNNGNDPSVFTGGLVGVATGSAVIANSFATGQITKVFNDAGGLVGDLQGGTLVDDYATISVVTAFSGYGSDLGGLVGEADSGSRIENSYATGAVTGHQDIGGLVGYLDGGSVSGSFATGAVSGANFIGGLVGESEEGAIADSYAMGSVSGSNGVGGLVGVLFDPSSSVTDSFSIGRVTGSANVGGLVGEQSDSGGVSDSYWDTETSGRPSDSAGATPLTTAEMQGTFANMPGFTGPTWATSAGLFPYLSWQYAGTPQAISGIAYSNGGGTVLQSGTVSALADGNALDTASTGANGYYYLLAAPGTISGSNAVLAYSSANGARLDTATDALDTNNNVSFFDVWGNTLIAPTSDTTYSTASATSLQTQDASLIAQAVGANTDPTTGVTNYGYVATGASFTIDQPLTLSNGLYVKSGNIAVDDALTLPGSEGLALESSGALTVDAPIAITGAGALTLDYSTSALTNLSFGLTSSGFSGRVNYGATDNGGTLTINGTPYTLVYSMSDVQNINASDAALVGDYALADSLDATGTTGWVPIGTASNSFGGTFEGLGNTISNLIVDMPSVSGVGLFGYATGSVFRDLGVVGGSFTGADLVGGLVGDNIQGTIANAYATGSVSGDSEVGGLVGNLDFLATITNAYATGAVSGSQDVGGLVGFNNSSTITNAYATGAVDDIGSGLSQYFGGLVGLVDDGGGITDAYATGAVMGSGSGISEYGGGLVGRNDGGIIDAYATGAVGGFRVVGGLVGVNAGGILDAYATGTVSGNANVGGLVGGSVTGAVLTDGYWDTQTSGIGTDGGGAAPLTTAEMQGTFANMPGFAGPTWATGTGLFPYLSWQFASTPQVVSGFTVTSNGKTGVSGLDVSLLVNGNGVTPAIATSSGANGYYYLLLQPGTIANSGSPLFAYLTNGTPGNSFVGNALGGDGNLEIEEDQLRVKSGAASVTGLFRALNTALGSNTGADFLYASADGFTPNTNLFLSDSAATFNVNAALDVGGGTLWLYDPKGAIAESGGGAILAGRLRGTTKNGVTLNGENEIRALGSFTNTGSGGFALTDGETLSVRGALSAGTGDLSLTTTNGGSIGLDNNLTTGGTLTLISAGTIWQDASSSVITANTLTGSSSGATRLQGANALTNLGAFTNTAGNFYLTNAQTLTVDGTVNAGSKVMSLNTTNGDLVVEDALDAGNLTLVSSLGEVEGSGAITANVINVTANTGIDLTGSNNIRRIGTNSTASGSDVINQ